jgi:4-amino-4-deoxy-L-arabinose transferase-like glycosyltransferase
VSGMVPSRKVMTKGGALRNVLVLSLLCIITRLAFLMYWPENYRLLRMDVDGYWGIGANLRAGNGFARGLEPITTATRSPMYPVFLAGVHWVTGGREGIALVSQAALDAVTCVGIYFLAVVVTGSVAAACLACLFWAVYLPEVSEVTRFWSEPLCALFVTYALLLYIRAREYDRLWLCGLAGILFGGAALTRSVFLFLPLLLAGLLLIERGEGRGRRSLFASTLLLGFILSMAPWVIRNAVVFRAFIPGYTQGGITLYQAHARLGADDYLTYVPHSYILRTVQARIATDPEWARAEHSEVELDLLCAREGLGLIREHPVRYAKLSVVRALWLWFNIGYGRVQGWTSVGVAAINGGLLTLGIIGLISGRLLWASRAMPLVATLIYATLVPALVLAVGRYIFPVIPALVVLSASGFMVVYTKVWSHR